MDQSGETGTIDLSLNDYGKSWSYRGEGNANLILAIPAQRRVLRLKKCARFESEEISSNSYEKRAIWEVRWWKMFSSFLGSYAIRDDEKVDIVYIRSCDLFKLNEYLNSIRPVSRLHKQVASSCGVLFPDFTKFSQYDVICGGDTFTFELKPKHAWTPYIIILTNGEKYGKCPYCLTQFLKLKKAKIKCKSEYCPLDLFSGDEMRMTKAIRNIIREPQNNFKFFKNGNAVPTNHMTSILKNMFTNNLSINIFNSFIYLIYKTLLKSFNIGHVLKSVPYHKIRVDENKAQVLRKLADLGLPSCNVQSLGNLPEDCLLERLLKLQLLDCDVDLPNLQHGDGYDYIEGMLKILENTKESLENLTNLQKSMMAATVKDCSVMLTFRPLKQNIDKAIYQDEIVGVDGQYFAARASVIDLDLKPESRINNYLKHIDEMFKAALECMS